MKLRSETTRTHGLFTLTEQVSFVDHRVTLLAYSAQFKLLQPALDRGPMLVDGGAL